METVDRPWTHKLKDIKCPTCGEVLLRSADDIRLRTADRIVFETACETRHRVLVDARRTNGDPGLTLRRLADGEEVDVVSMIVAERAGEFVNRFLR